MEVAAADNERGSLRAVPPTGKTWAALLQFPTTVLRTVVVGKPTVTAREEASSDRVTPIPPLFGTSPIASPLHAVATLQASPLTPAATIASPPPAKRKGNDRILPLNTGARLSFGQILDLHATCASPTDVARIELTSRDPSPSPPLHSSHPSHPWIATEPATPERFRRTPHITASLRLHRSRTSFADVTAHVTDISEWACSGGGYCDVHTGVLAGVGPVALKKLRMLSDAAHAEKRFRHEAHTWCRLDHRHVLPFLGICVDGPTLYMCSPWQERGDLPHYLKARPDVDRLALITQTADALHYLHENSIIHGDIKGNNVLISSTGEALLCDFGLSMVLSEIAVLSGLPSDMNGVGTGRYMAPELFAGEDDVAKSFSADIFAFGMLISEIITGHLPLHYLRHEAAVLFGIAQGKRPWRPLAWRDTHEEVLWLLAERCWDADPEKRPTSADLRAFLRWYAPVSRGEESDEEEPMLWARIGPHVREKTRCAPLPINAERRPPQRTATSQSENHLRATLARDISSTRIQRMLMSLIILDLLIALLAVVQAIIAGLVYSRGSPYRQSDAVWPLTLTASIWTTFTYIPLCTFQILALVFLREKSHFSPSRLFAPLRLSTLYTPRTRVGYAVVACALFATEAGLMRADEKGRVGGEDVFPVVHEALAWLLAALAGGDGAYQALRVWGVITNVPTSTESALSRSYVLSA